MPQIFKIGSYLIYFWSNENQPLEPVHVHVTKGVPSGNDTKIWITKTGKCLVCHNKSKIPERQLKFICEIIEARSRQIMDKWVSYFGAITYYC